MKRFLLVLAAGAVLLPALAHSSVPNPADCTVGATVVSCPEGDSTFIVIARHIGGRPIAGGFVLIDFCSCSGFRLGPTPHPAPYTVSANGCQVSASTDVNGVARFPLIAGGQCRDASIQVWCDGVQLATRAGVATFDQDGDFTVTQADIDIIISKAFTNDPSADFDGDGTVTETDLEIAQSHLGHSASAVTSVGPAPAIALAAMPIPNPSHGRLEFALRNPLAGAATLAIYDVSGRQQVMVLDQMLDPGVHRVAWSGEDARGQRLTAGLYFYRFVVGGAMTQGTLVIAR